jgi:peptidoglycan/LPS O-acetylase OafA/YrhL
VPESHKSALKYRSDIDGLRAIGVLSVILFHLDVPYFSGGFVGVDIFFVISGYLITKILADEIDEGHFSLLGFYERRVRRILPALFVMLSAVSFFGYVTLMPSYYLYTAQSAAAAAFSLSNVFFYWHGGYFDFGGLQLVPLLHTWSLGVEEQFYIVFPLFFLFGRRVLRLPWIWIIFPLFVVSLAFGVIQTEFSLKSLLLGTIKNATHNGAFYLPISRSWEFLMGSALAVGAFPYAPNNTLIRNGLAWLGLILILISLLIFDSSSNFPGFAALIPCLGSALIIYANFNYTTIVGRLLSSYLMVWIGLISYSLYLWHWPLIAFMRLIWGGEQPLLIYLLLFASMFPIAWVSWRFVERPFRRNISVFTRGRLFVAASFGAFSFLGMAILANKLDGLPFRFSPAALAIAEGAKDGNPIGDACDAKPVADIMTGRICTIGRAGAPLTFALIGDSFANALTPGVEVAADQAGQRGYVLTRSWCYALIGVNSNSDCKDFIDAAIAKIKATPTIKTVILISRWTAAAEGTRFGALTPKRLFITDAQSKERSYAENKAVIVRSLERNSRTLADYRVVLVAFIPEQLTNVTQSAALRIQFGWFDVGTPREIVERRQANVKRILTTAATHYGFDILDAMSPLCDEQTCRAIEDGKSLYADDNHLSRFGAIKESILLAAAFRKSNSASALPASEAP